MCFSYLIELRDSYDLSLNFKLILCQQIFFCFLEVKFPTKFGETVESALDTGFCRSYLSGFGPVGKLNALNAIICDWLICALNVVCNSNRRVF